MPNNKTIMTPSKFKKPKHISETGLLLDYYSYYKKNIKAANPAVKNIKIGNLDLIKDDVCDAFINLPAEFNILEMIYGSNLKELVFIDQGLAGTCFTAAQSMHLSIELSKLLDFPFMIDYCLLLQDIYDAYYKYGIPQFGKFIIKPDGTFAEIALPVGISTLPDTRDFPLWTYAFDYLLTQYPIIVYPICDGLAKNLDYGDYALPFNMGLLVKPNCTKKPEQCGIKISLQNFKKKYVLKSICSIKQYLISNGGQTLSIAISGSLFEWLRTQTDGAEFKYPEDTSSIIVGLYQSYGGGSHQVNIVGWSTPEPGYTKFIFKNSWDNKANFYFTIKDEDYDSASLPIFAQIHQSNYTYNYDIIFVDYQNKSLEEIRSIFKDKIQNCCGLGTCCGDVVHIDYCEENISKVECYKQKPESITQNPDCDKSLFIPNRTLNNFFDNIEGEQDSWYELANNDDLIQDEILKNDIILFYNTPSSQRSKEVEENLKNRIVLEFEKLSTIVQQCPCCEFTTVTPTPTPETTPTTPPTETTPTIPPTEPTPPPGYPVNIILSNFTGAAENCSNYNGTYTIYQPYIDGDPAEYNYPVDPPNSYSTGAAVKVGYSPNFDDVYVCLYVATPEGDAQLCQSYDVDWSTGNYAIQNGFPSTPWCIGDISLEFSF